MESKKLASRHFGSCRFLFEVQQHSKVNKMSVENLATVMGVNLFKPQVEDAFSMMKGEALEEN